MPESSLRVRPNQGSQMPGGTSVPRSLMSRPQSSHSAPQRSNSSEGERDYRRPSIFHAASYQGSSEVEEDFLDRDSTTADLTIRWEDAVWYNPSLEQMVEALQAQIMRHGVLEPIPVKYNTYVLHLLEGFSKAKINLQKADKAYEELKQINEDNIENWLVRESEYQAEVKRLEILLASTSQRGLEAVTLARANSLVDRSRDKALELFTKVRARRGSDYTVATTESTSPSTLPPELIPADQGDNGGKTAKGRDRKPVMTIPNILDNDKDRLASQKIRRLDALAKESAAMAGRRACRRHHDSSGNVFEDLPVVAKLGDCDQTQSGAGSPTDKYVSWRESLHSTSQHDQELATRTPVDSANSDGTVVRNLAGEEMLAATTYSPVPKRLPLNANFLMANGLQSSTEEEDKPILVCKDPAQAGSKHGHAATVATASRRDQASCTVHPPSSSHAASAGTRGSFIRPILKHPRTAIQDSFTRPPLPSEEPDGRGKCTRKPLRSQSDRIRHSSDVEPVAGQEGTRTETWQSRLEAHMASKRAFNSLFSTYSRRQNK